MQAPTHMHTHTYMHTHAPGSRSPDCVPTWRGFDQAGPMEWTGGGGQRGGEAQRSLGEAGEVACDLGSLSEGREGNPVCWSQRAALRGRGLPLPDAGTQFKAWMPG